MSMVHTSGCVLADVLETETIRLLLLKDCTIYSLRLFAEGQFTTSITKQ